MHLQLDNRAATKRILVTGANGFLGRHVSRMLAKLGYSVAGLGHGTFSQAELGAWGIDEWHEGDVTLESLMQYENLKAIFHCAGSGSVNFALQQPSQDFRRTVVTTSDVLEFVRSVSPSTVVVYPSSASVYGTIATMPIGEDAATLPISTYGTHKLLAEHLVKAYAHNFGAKASIVRFFSIYGCGLRKQLLWDACVKLAGGDEIFNGTGDEVRDWLHVEDAAELLIIAMQRASPSCPVVNGGTGTGVSVPGHRASPQHRTADPAATEVFRADPTRRSEQIHRRHERRNKLGLASTAFLARWRCGIRSLVARVGENFMMNEGSIPIAFVVHERIWLGGLNYLRNVMTAARRVPNNGLVPVIVTGIKATIVPEQFPGIEMIRTALLDRKSPAWVVRKAIATIFGRDLLLEKFLGHRKIRVLSHSGHLGRQRSVATIGWIPDFQHLLLASGVFPGTTGEPNPDLMKMPALDAPR